MPPQHATGDESPVLPPRRPKRPRFSSALLLVAILCTALTGWARLGPMPEALMRFLAYQTPLVKLAWVATHHSGLCDLAGLWSGFDESLRVVEAQDRLAPQCRLLKKDPAGPTLWRTPAGDLWFPSNADAGTVHFSVAQISTGLYPALSVRPGDVAMDCGGFIGEWAAAALRAGASKVIVFEPATPQLECIRRNLAGGIHAGRVIVVPKGVWDRNETLALEHSPETPAADRVVAARSGSSDSIDLTTIDDAVARLGLDRLDVIKMDIEGAEVRAIYGARSTLRRFKPRLAIATEHTASFLQNDLNVLQAMHAVAPFYRPRCGHCSHDGNQAVPQTLYFFPL